jgi:hypothetical protein
MRLWPPSTPHPAPGEGTTYPGSRPGPTTPADGGPFGEPVVLNPLFVEWLMGWPLGWTDCTRSATASYRWWWQSHSSALRDVLASSGSDGVDRTGGTV